MDVTNRWRPACDRAPLSVTEEGGHLDAARFQTNRGLVAPLHVAPWADDPSDPALPPMLRLLRGDFFPAGEHGRSVHVPCDFEFITS